MTGPRRVARRLWRQITWRLFASYLVVGLVGIGVLALSAAVFSSSYFSAKITGSDLPGFQRSLFQGLVAAMAVAIFTSVAVSLFVSHRIVGPLHQIMDASRRIASGHYEERVPVNDDFEITQLAASFNKMADALAQTESRRQALIADVAHELRTPLTSIKGYMEALLDGVMPADQETYTLIYHEADRLYRLVKDLQELSRLEARQTPLELHPVVVRELVHGVIGRARPQFEAKGIGLTSVVAPEVGMVLGDADRLFQVLLNLLANAVQYTPAGGRVRVTAFNERDQVCISVEDNGIGIAPEYIEQIFGRFYRIDKSRSRLGGGTGIGLTIARHLAGAHGGDIAVASTPGLGSTFTVALPAYTPPASPSAAPAPALVTHKA
ncbi:MAG TPA: HAMP domain-containing sensor histidine kinase [Chloroflexota bacterium]|nr:HAMP domain-containing sensor histidine kinase [Chloroflexota bacterium]